MIVLYQGLKDNRFYWEVVSTGRKVVIVTIKVFLSQYNIFYKGATAVIVMVALYRVQNRLKPFKSELNNQCELIGFKGKYLNPNHCLACIIMLFSGLMFSSNETRVGYVEIFALIAIVINNVHFILFWTYLMCNNQHRYEIFKKISLFLKILL